MCMFPAASPFVPPSPSPLTPHGPKSVFYVCASVAAASRGHFNDDDQMREIQEDVKMAKSRQECLFDHFPVRFTFPFY